MRVSPSQTTFDIRLALSSKAIDDVVVVGYGTVKRRDLVGAVDQVDRKVIEDRSTGTLARALQGQLPGLNITFTDSKPTRGASVNVRGSGSIGAGGSTSDIQTQAAFKTYWAERLEEDPDIDPYNDLFCDLLEENARAPQISGRLRRLAQLDGA